MENTLNYKILVGNDNGNSEHDIVLDGNIVQQPNVFAKVRELPVLDDINVTKVMENIEDYLIVTIVSNEVPTGIYYIGNYALHSGKRVSNMEVGVLNDKANSDIVVVNTLAQIAANAVKKAYEVDPEFKNKIDVSVDMTTALPVKQYNKSNVDKLMGRFLNNEHEVKVHVGTLTASVYIKFDFVKLIPESVDIVFALQNMTANKSDYFKETYDIDVKKMFAEFNETYKLNVDGNYFKKIKMLHVGIGEGTTEFPRTDDIVFDPNFITGTDNGVGHAIENALPLFKEKTLLRTFTRQSYSEIIKDKGHKYYDKAMDCLEEYLDNESEDILHVAKGEIEKANNDVDIICVHGGGSITMRPFLYEKLKSLGDKIDVKVFYVPEEYAVILESVGLYEFTKSNLFKALKKNSKDNGKK